MAIFERDITQSKDAANHPWIFNCDDIMCHWTTAHKTREAAEAREVDHPHPHDIKRSWVMDETDEKGMPYTKPHYGKSIAEKLWDELDRVVDEIRAEYPTNVEYHKAYAQGLVFALVPMCKPYYEGSEAVLKQAMRRWKMRQGEMEWEPTAGYHYNPPPPGSKLYEREKSKQPKMPAKPVEKELSDEDKAAIIGAHGAGFFTVEQLANTYDVSVATVKKIVGS